MSDQRAYLDAQRAERERRYDAGVAEYHRLHDPDNPPHLAARAIADCSRCDDDGYRGSTICDHQDHYAATAPGRAAVADVLDQIRQRKTPPTQERTA